VWFYGVFVVAGYIINNMYE